MILPLHVLRPRCRMLPQPHRALTKPRVHQRPRHRIAQPERNEIHASCLLPVRQLIHAKLPLPSRIKKLHLLQSHPSLQLARAALSKRRFSIGSFYPYHRPDAPPSLSSPPSPIDGEGSAAPFAPPTEPRFPPHRFERAPLLRVSLPLKLSGLFILTPPHSR